MNNRSAVLDKYSLHKIMHTYIKPSNFLIKDANSLDMYS